MVSAVQEDVDGPVGPVLHFGTFLFGTSGAKEKIVGRAPGFMVLRPN